VRDDRMHQPPRAGVPPPGYIRGLLIAGCIGVSGLHGSNDGQKSIGLMILVMIGMFPAAIGLNPDTSAAEYTRIEEHLDACSPCQERLLWCDVRKDPLLVALRGARVRGRAATLYAGAGVVRGSDPEAELEETRLKLRPALGALLEI